MDNTNTTSLEDFKIKSLPSSAFYIPNFITEQEEQLLSAKIEAAPKPRWKQLSKRRLQTWPSDLTKNTLLDSPLPNWLVEPCISRMMSFPRNTESNDHIFYNSPHSRPNHVLINEYLSGQGIMPHKDGDAYYPVVATVSLGSSLCLDIYGSKEDGTIEGQPRWKILQEPRSLLITTDDLYTEFLHGIANVDDDVGLRPDTVANWENLGAPELIEDGSSKRSTRISLTYRDVIRVSNLGSKFGIFNKR